ncbi:Fic family protein [Methylocystis sp.]|uniref:Fic family protein n=1 Tax=Methylocystis sp. TaxID=1911079 RepID=UPI003DA64F2F
MAHQSVSGPIGREHVHFEAPDAERLEKEMRVFLDWFEADVAIDPVIKAGIAHLWFVTIHPFEDGNGRIARAVADLALERSEENPQRFYSMSAQIRLERNAYYDMLQATQKGDLDITAWLEWFLKCLDRTEPSTRRRQSWLPSCEKHASGTPKPESGSMTVNAPSSIGC